MSNDIDFLLYFTTFLQNVKIYEGKKVKVTRFHDGKKKTTYHVPGPENQSAPLPHKGLREDLIQSFPASDDVTQVPTLTD